MKFETDRQLFGLTGGMGSGKSTVSTELAERGVVIVDADQVVHDLQAPGGPAIEAMAEILGRDVVDDGVLNRPLAGERMFADAARNRAVKAMLSPLIHDEMLRQIQAAGPEDTVLLDVPLLVESGTTDLTGIIVVDTEVDLAVERLQKYRGFTEAQARARIATQASREVRLSYADFVIDNNGDESHLAEEIERAWRWLQVVKSVGQIATHEP